jgi:hypothetical protein
LGFEDDSLLYIAREVVIARAGFEAVRDAVLDEPA